MVKILKFYLIPKKSNDTLSKGAIFFWPTLYLECWMQTFKKILKFAFISLSVKNILSFFCKFGIDKPYAVKFKSACNLKRVNFLFLQNDLKRCTA